MFTFPVGIFAPTLPVTPVASRSTGTQGISVVGLTPLRVTTIPIPVPSDIGAGCSVTFSNQSSAFPNVANGPSISNFNVSVYEGVLNSGEPVPTGPSLATWTNQTVPGAGGIWTSPTFDATGHGGANYLIIVIGNPVNSSINVAQGITTGEYVDGTSTTDPLPGGMSGSNNAIGTARITGWTTAKHRLVVAGDSLVNAYSSVYTVRRERSAFVKIGPDNNWSVDTMGIQGMTLAQATSLPNFFDGVVVGSKTILLTNLSINSLPGWADLAAAQADYAAFIVTAHNLGFTKIVLSTLPPSVTYLANNTIRQTVNTWMLTQIGVGGITSVVDIDLVVRDPSNHTQLLPSYALPDGTHWTVNGHAAVGTQITSTVGPLF